MEKAAIFEASKDFKKSNFFYRQKRNSYIMSYNHGQIMGKGLSGAGAKGPHEFGSPLQFYITIQR